MRDVEAFEDRRWGSERRKGEKKKIRQIYIRKWLINFCWTICSRRLRYQFPFLLHFSPSLPPFFSFNRWSQESVGSKDGSISSSPLEKVPESVGPHVAALMCLKLPWSEQRREGEGERGSGERKSLHSFQSECHFFPSAKKGFGQTIASRRCSRGYRTILTVFLVHSLGCENFTWRKGEKKGPFSKRR